MKEKNIDFILIQIDEAHSTAWPTGLKNNISPQKSLTERFERAKEFIKTDNPPFTVLVDTWSNSFAEKYKAWPDKYYCIDKNFNIIEKSEYGLKKDALINKDCCEVITELLNK